MRLVEAVETVDAVEHFVDDAVHDLPDLAMDIGVQPVERGGADDGAAAAEKSVALDENGSGAVAGGGDGGGDAGRAGADDDHIGLGDDRRISGRFLHGFIGSLAGVD